MERRPHYIYLLLLCLSTGGALRVTVWPPEVSALTGQDVSIVCDVSELNLNRAIDLVWSRKSEGKRTDVYQYHNGEVKTSTPRYHVTTEEILRGNATLHISALQVADEGQYTCDIINTPEHREGSSTLLVSAPPSVTLTPEDPSIVTGSEISAMCELTGFYPQAVTIRWVRHHKHSPGYDILQKGKCTTDPEMNSDGTFNIISQLSLRPQEVGTDRYSCNVTHRSLEKEAIVRSFTLTVTEKEDNTGTIVWAVIITIIVILLAVGIPYGYITILKPCPPTVSEITGNDELTDMGVGDQVEKRTLFRPKAERKRKRNMAPQLWRIMTPGRIQHGEKVTLTCPIGGFKPKALSITWLRKEKEDGRETELLTWKTGEPHTPSGRYSHTVEEKEHNDHYYTLMSDLTLTATIREDDGVTYICRTFHPSTLQTAEESLMMEVTAVPVMDAIEVYWDTPGGDLTLRCRIHSFYPKVINVKWYTEKGEEKTEMESRLGEIRRDPEKRYHVTSKVTSKVSSKVIHERPETTLRCQVWHESLTTPISTTRTLGNDVKLRQMSFDT